MLFKILFYPLGFIIHEIQTIKCIRAMRRCGGANRRGSNENRYGKVFV